MVDFELLSQLLVLANQSSEGVLLLLGGIVLGREFALQAGDFLASSG